MVVFFLNINILSDFILNISHMSKFQGFPGGSGVKNPLASAGDTGLIPVCEDPTCYEATKPRCHSY